jgi:UDP-3-O-[3-hydroxymyristoyl] glucosamine N-acyltransferase
MICSQVGIAGSTRMGKNIILAGQAGIAGHCSIGDGAILTAQSGVSHDVAPGEMLSGSPAFDNRLWLRSVAAFSRLGEIAKTVRSLSRQEKGKG